MRLFGSRPEVRPNFGRFFWKVFSLYRLPICYLYYEVFFKCNKHQFNIHFLTKNKISPRKFSTSSHASSHFLISRMFRNRCQLRGQGKKLSSTRSFISRLLRRWLAGDHLQRSSAKDSAKKLAGIIFRDTKFFCAYRTPVKNFLIMSMLFFWWKNEGVNNFKVRGP